MPAACQEKIGAGSKGRDNKGQPAPAEEAAEAAGMSKPSSTQMSRLDLSEGDSAVAYQQKEPGLFSRILSSLHGGVYAVVEYFD